MAVPSSVAGPGLPSAQGSLSRPLPFLAGVEPVQADGGILGEGPQGHPAGAGRVYAAPQWAALSDEARVRWLRQMVREYAVDARLAGIVVSEMRKRSIAPRDWPAIAAAIHEYVRDHVTYVNEPGERIASPWATLQMGYGDCDDMAILACALAESVALPNRFCLAGLGRDGRQARWIEGHGTPSTSTNWGHVYCQMGWPPGRPTVWRSAETTMPGAPLGYDLVRHGIVMDKHGRPHLPSRSGRSAAGTGVGASPLGAFGAQGDPREEAPLVEYLTSWKFARSLILGSVEAVVTGAVVYYLLWRNLDKAPGRRKNPRRRRR